MRSVLYLLIPTLLFACSNDRRQPPPGQTTLESITLSPGSAMLERDATATFTASGAYSDGTTKDITASVAWSSSDETVATVVNGVVTAVAAGTTKIEAALDDQTASANVVVAAGQITGLTIDPTTATIDEGATVQIRAMAHFEDGTTMDVTTAVDWTTTDETVASVASGLVTAVARGVASISATDPTSGMQATPAVITVSARAPMSITVEPATVQVPVGSTQQFTAMAHYADGTDADITATAQWSSSSEAIASIDAAGLASALTAGLTSITATHVDSGVHASVSLRVVPAAILTLTVTPTSAVIGQGERISFHATADYTDGATRDLTAAVTWSSSDPSVATVSNTPGAQGEITTVGPGTTTLSVVEPTSGKSSEDTHTSGVLTILPARLQSIVILPPQTNLALGLTQQYRAIGLYSDNSSADLSARVLWDSSNVGAATIDAAGLVTSVAVGATTISAFDPPSGLSSDDANQSAQLTITPPALTSIAVTPPTRTMVVGGTQQFTATGHYTDDSQQVITQTVVWDSSSPAITIAPGGLATAQQSGSAVISATDPATQVSSTTSNQSANVNVSIANLVSLAVMTSTTVPVGADVQFIAVGSYDNGATQDLTTLVSWGSDNTTAVHMSNATGSRGVGTGLAAGVATISAVDPGTGIGSAASGQSATMTVSGGITLNAIGVQPPSTTVDIGDTVAFTAIGSFSNGARYIVTNSVTWSVSSSPATISNVEGSRGVATGVAVGTVTVTARHVPTAVSGTATLLVELGIVTVSGTWPGPTVSVDATPPFGVNVGMVDFAAGAFPPGAVITDVDVTINFLKTDGSCAAPASADAYHAETSFRIQGPTNTQVVLAPPGTWSGGVAISPVTVTFDQSAVAIPANTPVSGTFLPNTGDLTAFNGQSPVGTWILQAGDATAGDPLCVNSYTVTITAQ